MRSEGARIGNAGVGTGIKHYVKMMNELQLWINQRGLRPGAFAMYLEPWHADIFTFLEILPRKHNIHFNAADLKYALWIPDNFMRALENDGMYYLFSPDEAVGLYNNHSDKFEELYNHYVQLGKEGKLNIFKEVKALDIFKEYFITLKQVGNPYFLYKDTINKLSNMKNIATICSSNLCAEITLPSWSKFDSVKLFGQPTEEAEYGVCNLAALCLGNYVNNGVIDYRGIMNAARQLVISLDNVIDINYYPAEPARRSNFRHRPIGIGVIGLADVLAKLKLTFGSKAARDIDMSLSAAIYYAAMHESTLLGEYRGSYESYTFKDGAPALHGLLQPDLHVQYNYLNPDWEKDIERVTNGILKSEHWEELRNRLKLGFLRNSYVTAYMPTATTSNIVSQNENFEPITSNIYKRSTMSGQFLIVNKYLLKELQDLGIWNDQLRLEIIQNNGSVQGINRIPAEIQKRFKTVRELKQEAIIAHAKARGAFICQTQSMNLYPSDLSMQQLLELMLFSWKLGIKTGHYYVHSQAALKNVVAGAINREVRDRASSENLFEEEPEIPEEQKPLFCTRDNPDCAACSV
jgi:ribonucleoside-diphosphate reductase alpha subunit